MNRPETKLRLAQADRYQAQGAWQSAEVEYQQLLASDPQCIEAWELRALLMAKIGRFDLAERYLREALKLAPHQGSLYVHLALTLGELGRLTEAVQVCQEGVSLSPDRADYHFNFGVLLDKQEKWELAAVAYQKAAKLDTNPFEATVNLGNSLQKMGNLAGAFHATQQALKMQPNWIEGYVNLGSILQQARQYENAVLCLREAIRLNPRLASAYTRLGSLYMDQHEYSIAKQCYAVALDINPHDPNTLYNMGVVLHATYDSENAMAMFQKVLQLAPEHAEAHYQIATLYKEQSRHAESIRHYEWANTYRPGFGLIDLVHARQHLCQWDGIEDLTRKLIDFVATHCSGASDEQASPFAFMTLPLETTGQQQLHCAQHWSQRPSLMLAASVSPQNSQRRVTAQHGKLTIGYLSSDFHVHATTWLMAQVFESHDRTQFSVVAYSYGPSDNSPTRQRLIDGFDRFVDIRGASFAEAARVIETDGIDILVDLKGYTFGSRPEILAHRPAPLQVQFLGYPGTMGADFVDYVIADRFVIPTTLQPYFSEKVIYLPGCYQPNDQRCLPDPKPITRSQVGLPDDAFVFCSFNNSYKLTPAMFELWLGLLRKVPRSVLWILEPNAVMAEPLRKRAALAGIHSDRLVFAPRLSGEEHLQRHACADLFLDSFPVNAHTTASDCLRMGVPMVTLAGQTFISRVAGSLLHTLGLDELIVSNLAAYESLALALATDPSRYRTVQQRLKEALANTSLFDGVAFARGLEQAYRMAWARHAEGKSPESFQA